MNSEYVQNSIVATGKIVGRCNKCKGRKGKRREKQGCDRRSTFPKQRFDVQHCQLISSHPIPLSLLICYCLHLYSFLEYKKTVARGSVSLSSTQDSLFCLFV